MGRDTYLDQNYYDAASIQVATWQTNRDIRANEPALWSKVQQSTMMRFSTSQTVTIRLNDSTNGAIVITSSQSPMIFDYVRISNIYVTNASGSTADIKIELYP